MEKRTEPEELIGMYCTCDRYVFINGKAVQINNEVLNSLPDNEDAHMHINQWALNEGHIKQGEVIGVLY